MGSSINALMKTEWYEAAAKAYRQYLEAHKRQKCQSLSISFENFAREIIATPEHRRDEILGLSEPAPEELELACLQRQPVTRFRQYESPSAKEQSLGLSGKKPKGKKKPKRKG